MRKKFVAGNWKMNMTPSEASALVDKLKSGCETQDVDVAFLVPSIDVPVVKEKLKGSKISLGTQNFYFEDKGAYTGEISADMIIDAGATHVVIGHSERRTIFKEDDTMINKKLVKALNKGLIPILCCGESLDCRESNKTLDFVKGQLKSAFAGVDEASAIKTIVAYEPIWAIGTGKTATSDQAEEVCKFIRETLKDMYSENLASNIRILYGGSVKGENAKEIFAKPNIDGGLIGGASLKEDFINIVKYNG